MDPIAKLKAEMEAKKRKVQALDVSAEGAGSGDSAPKKKVYRTNGQTKQLLREIGVAAQVNASEHKSVHARMIQKTAQKTAANCNLNSGQHPLWGNESVVPTRLRRG